MSFLNTALRFGSAANTTALQRWAYALADYLDNGNGTPTQLKALFEATGIPLGSAFGQWAMSVSGVIVGTGSASDLARLLEQKTPVANGVWAEEAGSQNRLLDI